MSSAVQIAGLTKKYGARTVLGEVDLIVEYGQIVSILGPNGAGKTTTLEIIEGQRRPSSGRVRTLGHDPFTRGGFGQLRSRIGVALQTASFEPKLTVEDMVRRQASYYSRILKPEPLIEALSLGEYWSQRAGALSEGTKQRLNVLLALIGRPELVLLDEPTAGLDPVSRTAVIDLLRELMLFGMTVMLTSHHLEEIETLATRVVVIHGGRIMADGTPRALLQNSRLPTKIEFRIDSAQSELPAGALRQSDGVRYSTLDPEKVLSEIRAWEAAPHNRLSNLSIMRPTLNDAYIELIAKGATR